MPAIIYPNLGLKAGFALGENGWDDEMTLNILTLSILTQARAISKVAATPGAPTDGDVHIFSNTHPTEPNKIAARVSGAWVYITPLAGWAIYNLATGFYEDFSGVAWISRVPAGASSPLSAIYEDQKAANTAGGTATSGSWLTRTLNTEVYDNIGIALAANQLTVPAGTYDIDAVAQHFNVDLARIRLRNITAGTTILLSDNMYGSAANAGSSNPRIQGRFTIAVSSALEIQYRVATTRAANGLGVLSNWGEIEIYARVKLTKVV